MVNAESYYDEAASFGTHYIYPSLLVERVNGTTTIENCFATGNLLCDGITNHNNDSAIMSTTWEDNLTIKNCWGQATWSVPGGEKTAVRTVGKLPIGKDYTGDVTNVYVLNTSNYGYTDHQAQNFQTLAPEHNVSQLSTLYWLTNTVNMPALYCLDEEGDIAFATEATAVRRVAINKKLNASTIAETLYSYYVPGDTVVIEEIEGYALDESSIPAGGTAESFTMPAADVTLNYMTQIADYSVAEEILAKYNSYDADILTNGDDMLAILEVAEQIVAMKGQEQTPAVIQNAVNATAALVQIPYFLWVSFAAWLNYAVWQLNK